MGDVLEYLVDGTSGLAPGGVEGSAIIAGVCSKGEVGKGYLIGKRTDLAAILGTGPLVDSLRDVLAAAGQEPIIIAVPVAGQSGGYISQPFIAGSKVEATTVGLAQKNADIILKVKTAGVLNVSRLDLSVDGGVSFTEVTSAKSVSLQDTGATICFPENAELEKDAVFRVTVRVPVGQVKRYGDQASPLIKIEEADERGVLAGAQLCLRIVKSGGLNEGTYQYSVDGGDNYSKVRTIPFDGIVALTGYGVNISFPDGIYAGGVTYTCELLPPVPSIVDVMSALERPLALYDIEFVYVTGPSDSVDWAAAGAKTAELWNAHRPTYFKMETRLPYDGEDLNDYTAYLLLQRQNYADRFVQVCVQYGEVSDAMGERKVRNWCGLQAGRVISIPVQRATGRVKDGPISQGSLPDGWEAVQPVLEEAGYLTAKKYAGLNGAYWGDSRTLAEDTSDYRYEEVLRTTFKAVRKMRIAALKSMYDEMGDPLAPEEGVGDGYLLAQLEAALDTMVQAKPKELAGYKVTIPPGQDRINNGTAVESILIGIGINRSIKLFASYVYAGGRFDPRLA